MEIIKNNHCPDKKQEVVCPFCKSILSITNSDIMQNYPDPNDRFAEYYNFIVCPCCDNKIVNIKTL